MDDWNLLTKLRRVCARGLRGGALPFCALPSTPLSLQCLLKSDHNGFGGVSPTNVIGICLQDSSATGLMPFTCHILHLCTKLILQLSKRSLISVVIMKTNWMRA